MLLAPTPSLVSLSFGVKTLRMILSACGGDGGKSGSVGVDVSLEICVSLDISVSML